MILPQQAGLLELAGLLFGGTALAALIPFALSPSPSATAKISVFSSGLLVGAALFVVIPEGVDQVYKAKHAQPVPGSVRTWIGVGLLAGFLAM